METTIKSLLGFGNTSMSVVETRLIGNCDDTMALVVNFQVSLYFLEALSPIARTDQRHSTLAGNPETIVQFESVKFCESRFPELFAYTEMRYWVAPGTVFHVNFEIFESTFEAPLAGLRKMGGAISETVVILNEITADQTPTDRLLR